jgi:predicted transcriptional regulator
MTERPRKSTRLTVSLEEQDYDALNGIALDRDVSLSWVVRQAVKQFIEREHDDKEILTSANSTRQPKEK